ncbi:hypothetical protein GHT06_015988 [Daphnia sinensis]|uniref:Uncharacterized protein n=1 Tax=Daphnia sinensis TaxID=1820382 RepID=A0AAD5PWS2_9CRUS|nr:hypothetical protein GHT06_015988 [Daphnia sinensis]
MHLFSQHLVVVSDGTFMDLAWPAWNRYPLQQFTEEDANCKPVRQPLIKAITNHRS